MSRWAAKTIEENECRAAGGDGGDDGRSADGR